MMQSTEKAIIIIAIIGSVSTLMASTGVISFSHERFAQSRIGFDFLPKSIGLFPAYGDMAFLLSFTAVFLLVNRNSFKTVGKMCIRYLILLAIILGIISLQSRNVIITMAVSLTMAIILRYWVKYSRKWAGKLYTLIFISGIASILTLNILGEQIIHLMESIGGTHEAIGTVKARLEQYSFGWSLVKDHMLFGADPDIQDKFTRGIYFIHNLWLKELVAGGMPALLIMLIIYLKAIATQVRTGVQAPESSWVIPLLSMLIGGLIGTQFYPSGTPIFWVLLGVSSSITLKTDNKQRK